ASKSWLYVNGRPIICSPPIIACAAAVAALQPGSSCPTALSLAQAHAIHRQQQQKLALIGSSGSTSSSSGYSSLTSDATLSIHTSPVRNLTGSSGISLQLFMPVQEFCPFFLLLACDDALHCQTTFLLA
ncbi:unnamed protein product, partial [Protopolystoma xenopodis]